MLGKPTSLRLTATVTEAIDHLAKEEDRNRASMLRRLLTTHPMVVETIAYIKSQKAKDRKNTHEHS
jgi:predicted transcriptional regulator